MLGGGLGPGLMTGFVRGTKGVGLGSQTSGEILNV